MELSKVDKAGAFPADAPVETAIVRWRKPLMLVVPLILLLLGGYLWLTSGRYVSTDNAYVQQDRVTVAPEVTGKVIEVSVRENQHVEAGQILFRLDPEPFRIAKAQAEAALASARLEVAQLRETYAEKSSDIGAAQAALALAESNFARQEQLLKAGFTTRANFDQARAALDSARQQLAGARAASANARAALGPGSSIEAHPLVRAAVAQLNKANLDLKRTVIRAPFAGTVSQTEKLQVGAMAMQGMSGVSVVRSDGAWIEANFKETDLENMRVGQPAEIKLDAYPHHPLKAKVASIGAGTGSEFSVLPAQNATGNWVKVTQRVPVRLAIVERPDFPLIAGLSAEVAVDTKPESR